MSIEENIKSVANALGKKTTQMTIITQDRDTDTHTSYL